MNITIADIMAKRVITVQPHHSIMHARQIMERNRISALPVVGDDNEALGIMKPWALLRQRIWPSGIKMKRLAAGL